MVTVHLQSSFVYLHIFTSTNVGVFGLKYAKLSTFFILQIFTTTGMVALRGLAMWLENVHSHLYSILSADNG